ncbi:MAG: hypothetical protein ABI675_15025 [Chitinophagaceae bacterium]
MKRFTCMFFLLLSVPGFANTDIHKYSTNQSNDPLPLQLSIAEKLWLFCNTFYLNNVAYCDSCTQLKLLFQPNRGSKTSFEFSDLIVMAINDFILYDNLTQNNQVQLANHLNMQQKADIINALIGWKGFANVDTAGHYIWYDFVVPKKMYRKRTMRKSAEGYAALTYAWLLRNEDINKWSMLIHFSRKGKHRTRNFDHRVYSYYGENYLIISSLFREALCNQLRACKKRI